MRFSADRISSDGRFGSARTGDPEGATAPLPIDIRYSPASQFEQWCRAAPARVLGAVQFGGRAPVSSTLFPLLHVDMCQLGADPLVEVWTSELPVAYGNTGPIAYACNDEVLFGAIGIDVSPDESGFEALVQDLYRQVFSLIESHGYPHLLRAWNYFPHMTHEAVGLENYQRFCRGRAQAFQDRYGDFLQRLPSASAVGSLGGGLCIYFVASRTPGRHRENPRQVSAYYYPPQYGPRSPSFARATLKRWGEESFLFISGTASIVGHESRHPGDIAAQLEETLRNLEILIQTTGVEEHAPLRGFRDLSHLKVYLREIQHYSLVHSRLRSLAGPDMQAIYLQGDICRGDLLVEIEGVAHGRCT